MDSTPLRKISILLNGEPAEVPAGLTVATLLEHAGIDPSRVAVELNRQIVPRSSWGSTPVDEGAQVEIVQFVGGG